MSEVFAYREQKAFLSFRNLTCPFVFLRLTLSAAFSKADLQRCSRLPLASQAAKGLPGASLPVSTQGATGRCWGPWAGYYVGTEDRASLLFQPGEYRDLPSRQRAKVCAVVKFLNVD